MTSPESPSRPAAELLAELFDTEGAIYMASRRDPAGCRVGLFGVPYDGTTSFRPGTRFGPAAIREVSSRPGELLTPSSTATSKTWPSPTWARWTFPSAPRSRWWRP